MLNKVNIGKNTYGFVFLKPALIVVDMLEEFVRGRLRSPRAEDLVPKTTRLVNEARRRGILVIHVIVQQIPLDRELKIWEEHAMAGGNEASIDKELESARRDIVLLKRNYSGFRDTGLDQILRELGVDTVILVGIHTHVCVLHTACDAFYYGYDIIVVRDAVVAFSEEDHEYALKYMERVYGAKLMGLDELLSLLGSTIG